MKVLLLAHYIRGKLNVLIPSQIRALRLKRDEMTQKELAELADMAQPRISAMERPGETTFNIDTLVRLAAAFKVGLRVEFVSFSEMLAWENSFSQDQFDVVAIDNDARFLDPTLAVSILLTAVTSLTFEVSEAARFVDTSGSVKLGGTPAEEDSWDRSRYQDVSVLGEMSTSSVYWNEISARSYSA